MIQALTAANRTTGKLDEIKKVIGTLKASKNPAELIKSMIAQNPAYKNALEYIQANGGDPKAAFEKLAREQGIDPGEISHMI
ncbi:MAG: hypothetical protein IJG87_03815 [Ruminococcus sp.]|nr:hypothetical protein [Ruminococcus sp.]